MANVKDDNENVLDIGQLVMCMLANPQVKGRIVKIKEGGILSGKTIKIGKQEIVQQIPGVVTVRCEFEFPFDPNNPVTTGLYALVDPTPGKAKEIKAIYEKKGHSEMQELPN